MEPRSIVKKLAISLYKLFLKTLPVDKRLIFFESNVGKNYAGNPKYVYQEMVKRGLDKKYRCVWSLEDTSIEIPGNAKKVERTRLSYLYAMARAKVLVSDTRLPSFIEKRPGTTYFQLWHGTPLKKLAMDMDVLVMSEGLSLPEYKRLFQENINTWDYLISQSHYTTEKFKSCFNFKKPILEIGFPRNDVLFQKNNKENIKALKNKYGLPHDKKIILYAPTWRDDEFYENGKYKFSTELDFDRLNEELSDTHIILVKMHYLVKDPKRWDDHTGFIYKADQAWDIQELYLISDIMITDYSSVMFDYALLKRPMIIYAPDYQYYKDNLRGFYFNIFEEFPGPVLKETKDLIKSIEDYNFKDYEGKYNQFLDKFTEYDQGDASSKLLKLILRELE